MPVGMKHHSKGSLHMLEIQNIFFPYLLIYLMSDKSCANLQLLSIPHIPSK